MIAILGAIKGEDDLHCRANIVQVLNVGGGQTENFNFGQLSIRRISWQ